MTALPDDPIRCPACQSVQVHAGQRGWNAWKGMRGANDVVLTCLKCGHKFAPGGVAPAASSSGLYVVLFILVAVAIIVGIASQ
jgi:hypothetical protein